MYRWLLFGLLVVPPVIGAMSAEASPYGDLVSGSVDQAQIRNPPLEFRLGGYAHDPQSPEKGSADLNMEVLLPKIATSQNHLWALLTPRPQVGGTLNFVGKTSNAYAGLTWTFDVYRGWFVEGSLGGAVNDGKTGVIFHPGFNRIGCNASFHENASIGYQLGKNWSLMGTLEHFSNAGLCVENRGLTNYGLRLGYAF